jgi:hypothetical protein
MEDFEILTVRTTTQGDVRLARDVPHREATAGEEVISDRVFPGVWHRQSPEQIQGGGTNGEVVSTFPTEERVRSD